MHDVFAAVRIVQLHHVQSLPKHAEAVALRIFGKRRWEKCAKGKSIRYDRDPLADLCFNILHTAGWEDHPADKNRTMANFELATIKYIDERLDYVENWPLYVENVKDPNCMVGIEQVFDVVVEFTAPIRFVGTIDGLVYKVVGDKQIPVLDENKTAARMDDGWRSSFEMSHQITGYCRACPVVFGFPVHKSRVTGLTFNREDPLPIEPATRDDGFYDNWFRWLKHTVDLYEQYVDDYEQAPRYTHSCMRYFRPCSLIPFCADTVEGRREQWDQMVPPDLSPTEEAILDKI